MMIHILGRSQCNLRDSNLVFALSGRDLWGTDIALATTASRECAIALITNDALTDDLAVGVRRWVCTNVSGCEFLMSVVVLKRLSWWRQVVASRMLETEKTRTNLLLDREKRCRMTCVLPCLVMKRVIWTW